jgi:hypothetical protein
VECSAEWCLTQLENADVFNVLHFYIVPMQTSVLVYLDTALKGYLFAENFGCNELLLTNCSVAVNSVSWQFSYCVMELKVLFLCRSEVVTYAT